MNWRNAPGRVSCKCCWPSSTTLSSGFLIGASIISALLGDYVEAAAIMAIVILNAVVGVVQEGKAEEALAALKKMAAPDAHVIRDGHRITVPARELVPGDIVSAGGRQLCPH